MFPYHIPPPQNLSDLSTVGNSEFATLARRIEQLEDELDERYYQWRHSYQQYESMVKRRNFIGPIQEDQRRPRIDAINEQARWLHSQEVRIRALRARLHGYQGAIPMMLRAVSNDPVMVNALPFAIRTQHSAPADWESYFRRRPPEHILQRVAGELNN